MTWGHRFMAPGPIHVRRFDDYVDALQKAKVVLDADRRKAIILADAKNLAFARGLELIEDEGLLEEVAGLVEWPVVLMGEFEAAFLDLPPEVIRATIRANQKCFVLRETPRLLPSWPALSRPSTRRRQARKRTEPRRGTAWMAGTRPAMTRPRERRQARQQVHPRLEPRRPRRRRGDRGRQRKGRARPPRRRAPLLADRPRALARRQGQSRQAARPAPRQARAGRLSREARHAGRTGRAHRGAGARACAAASSPTRASPRAPPISPRPISRPKWSASSPSCRA